MSLNGALQIGRSAILASQAAMQVAGNNMANAATPGFHRRTVHLAGARDEMIVGGAFVGTGVRLMAIKREVDTALQARFRGASSQEQAHLIDQRFLAALETLQNELTDNDLSSALSDFFNSFSELANNPEDQAIRSLVVETGLALADRLSSLGESYQKTVQEIDQSLGTSIIQVNDLLDGIALLNGQITQTEQGPSQAGNLRDRRDTLINELSELLEVTVIEQASGAVDVLVDSVPILLSGVNRGLELRTESVNGQLQVSLRVAADGTQLQVDSGRIGGLMRQRSDTLEPAISDLDTLAGELIFQINRTHSQGQGRSGFQSVQGTYLVDDTTATLNNVNAGLDFPIDNGSFFIHVTHTATGVRTTHQINVDGNADSLDDLINEINVAVGVPNVTAGTGLGNVFTLTAATGFEISFSDDTSGALAALGVNTFFTGNTASTIGINQTIAGNPNMLAAGAGHVPGSNDTALALADLQDAPVTALSGSSLREFWQNSVNGLAVKASAANLAVESAGLVRQSLDAQIQSVSGVSLDEEVINLLMFQRQFQAAARFIAVIDETLQTLLDMV
ncbi:MAG: flagellar hook-associated protein FlgK [Planctomycetes bacterium]|nr:flagellar hook-associated protein FlgK [Planctomycetota bacterium]